MVKRKANVHIEDWLGERGSPSLTANGPTVTVGKGLVPATVPVPFPTPVAAGPPVTPNDLASEVKTGTEPAEPVIPTGDDVASNHEEAARWF